MSTVVATARSSADPADVLRVVLTGVTWPLWSPVDGFALERHGHAVSGWTAPERVVGQQTVGDVRVFRTGRRVRRHRITEITASSVAFEITGAGPGSRLRAESRVHVSPAPAGGTLIEWSLTRRPVAVPARFTAQHGRRELPTYAAALARFASLSTRPPPVTAARGSGITMGPPRNEETFHHGHSP